MGRTISATAAAKNFGSLVSRVQKQRASYVIERGGVPVAEIGPPPASPFRVSDLVELFKSVEMPDERYWRHVKAHRGALNKRTIPKNPWRS